MLPFLIRPPSQPLTHPSIHPTHSNTHTRTCPCLPSASYMSMASRYSACASPGLASSSCLAPRDSASAAEEGAGGGARAQGRAVLRGTGPAARRGARGAACELVNGGRRGAVDAPQTQPRRPRVGWAKPQTGWGAPPMQRARTRRDAPGLGEAVCRLPRELGDLGPVAQVAADLGRDLQVLGGVPGAAYLLLAHRRALVGGAGLLERAGLLGSRGGGRAEEGGQAG
jgi:hypothetical protein